MDSEDDSSWSISIKTVGSEQQPEGAVVERDFTVNVSPEDDLTSLYDQIEGVTNETIRAAVATCLGLKYISVEPLR